MVRNSDKIPGYLLPLPKDGALYKRFPLDLFCEKKSKVSSGGSHGNSKSDYRAMYRGLSSVPALVFSMPR